MLDVLLRNVRLCADDRERLVDVGVVHGRIAGLGESVRDVHADAVIDCRGAYLSPGFGDAHNHMLWYGLSLTEVDLSDCVRADQVYDRVAARAARVAPGGWVVGNGLDDAALDEPLLRSGLDRAAGGSAVWLKHRSGHRSMVNSTVLAQAGALGDGHVPVPPGGRVVRDSSGNPTGLLEEGAQEIAAGLRGHPEPEEMTTALAAASRQYASEGLTHVVECGIGGGLVGHGPLEAGAYQTAVDQGLLDVRVDLMPSLDVLHAPDAAGHSRVGLDLGIRTGFGSDRLRLGPVKAWLDGAMLGRTAAVTAPFCDHGHGSGRLADDPATLRAALVAAHRGGWRLAMHAIGDRAMDLALDVVDEAQTVHPRQDPRHRIEHAGLVRPDQLQRMAHLAVVPVPQARFLFEIGDDMVEAVGHDRSDLLYRHRSFLQAGIRVPGSSDRPVATGAPLLGMESMVLRRSKAGQVIGAAERVDARTALRAYTEDEAWVCHDEGRRGVLRRGALADLVLLAEDPARVPSSRIGAVQVLATLLGGRRTHLAADAPPDLKRLAG